MTDPRRDSGSITLPKPKAHRVSGGTTPVAVSWSGGKDSALALHALLKDPVLRPISLVSVLVAGTDCLTMHGVSRALIDAQAYALALPVSYVRVPPSPSNEEYERAMQRELLALRRSGIRHVAFGDLFLEDIREYRHKLLAPLGMTAAYPVWGRDTRALAEEFIDSGFQAIVVCSDPARVDASLCGREFDRELLRDLPKSVDPCGENGEFHTFVYNGPVFGHPLTPKRVGTEERGGYTYCLLD